MKHRHAIGLLLILFVITRAFVFTGFPFSANFLDLGMQLLDPWDLEHDLSGALFYQHTQPPLFNAFVGVLLKLTPNRPWLQLIASVIYGAIGLFLVLGVYGLGVSLGASRLWSLAVASAFVFWPPNIYEQVFGHPPPEKWLSYDYPVTALVLAMALALSRFISTGRARWWMVYLASSAAAVLTRPFFHPVLWLVPTALVGLHAARQNPAARTRRLLAASAIALLLALAPAIRNGVLFGWATGSTLQGMNISSRTLFLPRQAVEEQVRAGRVTALALVPRFSEPEVYLRNYGEVRTTGNRFLDSVDKSTGHPNWNHFIMIRASREYQSNTMALLRLYPVEAAKSFLNGVYIFFGFQPHQFLWPLGTVPWGFWDVEFPKIRLHGIAGYLRYVLAPVVFAVLYFGVVFHLFHRRGEPLALFIVFALAYVFVMANLLELGHNGIFRKQIDPLLFAGAASWLTAALPRRPGSRLEPDGKSGIPGTMRGARKHQDRPPEDAGGPAPRVNST